MIPLEYPDKPKKTFKRSLRLSDFPAKATAYNQAAREYFTGRELTPGYLKSLSTIYPTRRGICFVLHGAMGFQERVFNDPRRYVYPTGAGMASAVFMPEPDHIGNELILVEGSCDALAIGQLGLRALSYLGTWIPEERLKTIAKEIRDPGKVLIIPDNDAPGQHGLRQLAMAFPGARAIMLPWGVKDVCDLSHDQRRLLLGIGI